jgi:undecaprenyl phosphate-alpha-L-ara4N flippase subunit ArnE
MEGPPQTSKLEPTPTALSRRVVLAVLLGSVALNTVGQLLFKAARLASPDTSMLGILLRPETWAALVFYGLSAVSWLWVLARAQLSFAYPVLALSFPLVVAASAVIYGEPVSPLHWLGVGVIFLGVSLLART